MDAGTCIPPDVLIALDRTLTMHRTAGGQTPPDTDAGRASSKWSMAINGIEQLTKAPLDSTIRFGLELWPKQSAGCITLSQRLQGMTANNPSCEGPEVLIPPALDTGAQISQLLDAETTPICFSTPTGEALIGAKSHLAMRQAPGKKQFVVLVTDGADWDVSCPMPNPLLEVDKLSDAGVQTLVVGFSAEASLTNGVGADFLNDMACAGGSAKNFATRCALADGGVVRAKERHDGGASNTLFFTATNAAELMTSLKAFAATVCCDCVN